MGRNPIAKAVRRLHQQVMPSGRPEPVDDDTDQIWCSRCGMFAPPGAVPGLVWVHGHSQCEVCHLVVDECCQGEML
jgi:hypothetical protein